MKEMPVTYPNHFKEMKRRLNTDLHETSPVDVSQVSGLLLDWLVATAKGLKTVFHNGVFANGGRGFEYFTPSQDGHKFVLGSGIEIRHRPAPWNDVEATWCEGTRINQFGPDTLTAGLRALVAGKLGPVLHIPNDVLAKIRQLEGNDSIEEPEYPMENCQ